VTKQLAFTELKKLQMVKIHIHLSYHIGEPLTFSGRYFRHQWVTVIPSKEAIAEIHITTTRMIRGIKT